MKSNKFTYFALILSSLVMACSEKENEQQPEEESVTPIAVKQPKLASKQGCALDTDCQTGAFCFQGRCAVQCTNDDECDQGYICSQRSGRCVEPEYASSKQRARIAQPNIELDFTEAEHSTATTSVAAVEILEAPESTLQVSVGTANVYAHLKTTEDVGAIKYIVKKSDAEPQLAKLSVAKKNFLSTGIVSYTFTIPTAQSSLGDQGEEEYVQLSTSVGNFELTLQPKAPVTGKYSGSVITSRFGSTPLPIDLAVAVTPANAKSIDDVKGIDIYLPVKKGILFSPDSVKENDNYYSKLSMTKDLPQNCQSLKQCWSASFTTNDFAIDGSKIATSNRKLQRDIRIEIDGIDADSMNLTGHIRDYIKGLYRTYNASSGQLEWATSTMSGLLYATRTDAFDPDKTEIKAHTAATQDALRPLTDAPIEACSDETISSLAKIVAEYLGEKNELTKTCKGLNSLDKYLTSDDAESCLKAAAEGILADENLTSRIITSFIAREASDTTPVAGFATFSDFLNNCTLDDSDVKKTVCKFRPEVACAVDLFGQLYTTTTEDKQAEAFDTWHQLLRESYLGKQYAAWQKDIITRQKWLDTSDAPKFAADEIKAAVMGVLKDWETSVLNAHLDIVASQFTQNALEVISRASNGNKDVKSSQYVVQSEYQQAWQGASDALSLGLHRYNELLMSENERTQKASELNNVLFDLYFSGLVESQINIESDNTSLNGGYSNSINHNMTALNELNQSFDDLVYMRDAEVAVSTSLNQDNNNTLALRAKRAKDALQSVTQKRDKVFADYQKRQIDQQSISATLKNSLESLMTEIVNICGTPSDCHTTDINEIMEKTQCQPNTNAFRCGFALSTDDLSLGSLNRTVKDNNAMVKVSINKETGKLEYLDKSGKVIDGKVDDIYSIQSLTNSGEAAEAILAYREALANIETVKTDFVALQNKLEIAKESCDSYAKQIEDWHKSRSKLVDDVKKQLDLIKTANKDIDEKEEAKVKAELDELQAAYEKQNNNVKEWKKLAKDNQTSQTDKLNDISTYEQHALWLEALSNTTQTISDNIYNGLMSYYGADSEHGDRLATIPYIKAAIGTSAGAVAANITATGLHMAAVKVQKDADLAQSKYDYQVDLNDRDTELAIQELELKLQKSLAEIDEAIDSSKSSIEGFENEIRRLKEQAEIKDTYNRDLESLAQMRSEYLQNAQDLLAKRQLIRQSTLAALEAQKHYLTLVQKAAMMKSQYDASSERLAKITNLYAAPAVIFSYASDLEAVESQLETAKERIYNYLAALEYGAVRPFVDIRRAVYLARSTNDLDAIMKQLEDVEDTCGGPVNTIDEPHAIVVSARESMGILADFENMNKAERFHYILRKGNVPVDALTKYSVDETVQDLLSKNKQLRSATFELTIDDFANLSLTCNAKISSFAFKLVGTDLIKPNAGTQVHPTMTLFYNSSAKLASCQPDIKLIAENLGYKTAYNTYTSFNVGTLKISPVAGVNEWGNNDVSLANYPLATSYTLLIDPEAGENAKINWDNLEDIEIKLMYSYQNVKTQNTCSY